MKKRTSRLLSALLVLCMVLALLPAAALAANDGTVEFGFSYYTREMAVRKVTVNGKEAQLDHEDKAEYLDGSAQILLYYRVEKDAKIVINCKPVDPSMVPAGDPIYLTEPFTSLTDMYPEKEGISVSKRADGTYDFTIQLHEDRFGKVTKGSPNDWLLEWQANEEIWDEMGNIYTGDIYVVGAYMVIYASDTPPAPSFKIELSAQNLTVDAKENVACEKYNIDGNNYFKLRDLAELLSGTGSQFEVGYDDASKTISITTGKAYTHVGGELEIRGDMSSKAEVSAQTIQIDGVKHDDLKVYNIGGNNFFQLRQLGDLLGFDVDYDPAGTGTAIVRSK